MSKKTMIGLDPLAWLSPDDGKSSAKKKTKKKAKKKAAKKAATKTAATKKKAAKKKVAAKSVASKPAAKKKVSARKKATVTKETILSNNTDVAVEEAQQPETEQNQIDTVQSTDPIQLTDSGDKTVTDSIIKLNSVQDISLVAELHKQVSETLKENDVVFDASDVERIDASTLQLLTCVFQQADKYGASVSWQSASDALVQSARFLGLQNALNLQ